jgi:hypothetical protein
MSNKPVTQDDLNQLKSDLIGMIDSRFVDSIARATVLANANTTAIKDLENKLKGN